MLKQLLIKLKESLISVIPVSLIIFILYFTPLVDFTAKELVVFLVSSLLLILGIGLFNLGADISMTPMGSSVGSSLVKSRKILVIVIVCFIIGVLVTVAEPDLTVLAEQVKAVINKTVLIVSIGVGVGIFLALGVLKIIFKINLGHLLAFFYMMLFAVAAIVVENGNGSFLPLAFDSGGVTTGPITVPFIMALGVGIASSLGGRDAKENSFGLISLCSVGPIIAILILGISINGEIDYTVGDYEVASNVVSSFFSTLGSVSLEVLLALGLIVVFFIVIDIIYLRLPKKSLIKMGIGLLYTFVGLVIFLTAAQIGFMPIGYKLGTFLASKGKAFSVVFGFILGLVVVLAEPAVHVLTKQVEEVTTGGVSKLSMLIALSLGVGISLGLSMLRVAFDFSILYIIIPGYLISLGLSFFVPKIYTAIAFDSGGVASGPLTSSFILPFAIGACMVLQGENKVLEDAFGVVALVAMTPLITIQLLGFKAVIADKVRKQNMLKKIVSSDDEQIIEF